MNRQLRLFVPETEYYELLKDFKAIDLASADVAVSFASVKESSRKSEVKTAYRQLQLEPSLANRFRGIVADTLDDLLNRLEDGAEIVEYENGTGSDNDTLEHIKLNPNDHVFKQIVPLSSPWDLEVFRERKDFINNLRYYAISLRCSGKPDDTILHAFRFFTDRFELNRSRWVATLRGHGPGYYDEVKEHGFFFDYQVDCLCRGEHLFILNRDKFQRIFRFFEFVQDDARDFVYGIQDRVPIANLDEFMAACKRDQRMAVKLADLSEQPHIQRLSMARIKRAIERRGLPVKTRMQDGKEMLVYATAYKAQFLHLLSDDYLSSPMTALEYESTVKRALKQNRRENGRSADVRLLGETKSQHNSRSQREHNSDVGNGSHRNLVDIEW